MDEDDLREIEFIDRSEWPVYIAFDVLLANTDRHSGNLLVEADPPVRHARSGDTARLWLFDFGWSGLWPPRKFGVAGGAAQLTTVAPDAQLETPFANALRTNMPVLYRQQAKWHPGLSIAAKPGARHQHRTSSG